MILANTSPKPELDRKAITTLGDSLYNRGDLFAAQFCYLMAQVGFGRYANVNHDSVLMSNSANAIRLILLGSSHHRAFRDFATSDAIQMTEIYEYACTLNDEHFSIVDFQPYKYLLATRMLDAGLNLKALLYLEQIARHIQRQPERYEGAFVGRVYTLADQLKYFDPVYERMMFEPKEETDEGGAATATAATSALDDQPWLKELQSTLTNNNVSVEVWMCLISSCFTQCILISLSTAHEHPAGHQQLHQRCDSIPAAGRFVGQHQPAVCRDQSAV